MGNLHEENQKKIDERNRKIYEQVESGKYTLEWIGEQHEVSRQRVDQIHRAVKLGLLQDKQNERLNDRAV